MSLRNKPRNLIKHLRSIIPRRPLRLSEAKHLAERQANHFRQVSGDHQPRFCLDHIGATPRVEVLHHNQIPISGVTKWQQGAWHVHINSGEPETRQRFTLAHEFKHVLDAGLVGRTYQTIRGRIDGQYQIEQICNHFAACLLMPKKWVMKLWNKGIQTIDRLAAAFDVSFNAMRHRLRVLGLVATDGMTVAYVTIDNDAPAAHYIKRTRQRTKDSHQGDSS